MGNQEKQKDFSGDEEAMSGWENEGGLVPPPAEGEPGAIRETEKPEAGKKN